MKGVMNFLEKAGLVKQDEPPAPEVAAPFESPVKPVSGTPAAVLGATAGLAASDPPAGAGTLNLVQIYADAGVPTSLYPAERLLRLVDGLSAMDANTRNLAIKAMDEADESWTIADPLRDAAAKLQALAAHGANIQQDLQQFEADTQKQLAAVRARQEQRVGEIRKQMAELDALLTRELTRGEQECATQEANLASAREQVARELAELAQVSRALQSLSAQFGGSVTNPTQE